MYVCSVEYSFSKEVFLVNFYERKFKCILYNFCAALFVASLQHCLYCRLRSSGLTTEQLSSKVKDTVSRSTYYHTFSTK